MTSNTLLFRLTAFLVIFSPNLTFVLYGTNVVGRDILKGCGDYGLLLSGLTEFF